MVEQRRAHPAVIIEAIRALATIHDTGAAPILLKIVADPEADPTLRLEAMTTLGALVTADQVDLLLDLSSDPTPGIRGGAFRALARVNPEAFMSTLAGLDVDRDWTVRSAQATALGTLPADLAAPRLTAMLEDRDQRVIPAVVAAVAAAKVPEADRLLLQRLRAP
jgi:HEAT repeat protein